MGNILFNLIWATRSWNLSNTSCWAVFIHTYQKYKFSISIQQCRILANKFLRTYSFKWWHWEVLKRLGFEIKQLSWTCMKDFCWSKLKINISNSLKRLNLFYSFFCLKLSLKCELGIYALHPKLIGVHCYNVYTCYLQNTLPRHNP